MTNFDEESRALLLNYLKSASEAETIPWEGGLDGRSEKKRRKFAAEYRQKMIQLKAKYGIRESAQPARKVN